MRVLGFLGRLCLSVIFLVSAVYKFSDLSMSESYLANGLCNVLNAYIGVSWIEKIVDYAMQMTYSLIIAAALIEGLGGLCLILGVQVRLAALLLALFLIPVTLVFHSFWLFEGDERGTQTIMFLKNLAIFGGLVLTVSYGTGLNRSAPGANQKTEKK